MKWMGRGLLVLIGLNVSCSDPTSRVDIPSLERIIEHTEHATEAGRCLMERALDDAQWLIGGHREAAIAARIPRHEALRAIVEWSGGLTPDHHICIISEKQVNYFSFDRSTHRVRDERRIDPSPAMMDRIDQSLQRMTGYRGGEDMIGTKDASLLYVSLYASGRLSTQFVTACAGHLPLGAINVLQQRSETWSWAAMLQGDLVRLSGVSAKTHQEDAR